MTTVREALENPTELSDYEFSIAIERGLVNKDRTITVLGTRLLNKEPGAYAELKAKLDKLYEDKFPDFVTQPVHKKYPRVFGYGYK